MTGVDHVREAETLLVAAAEAQPTDEAALLVARAQVHATLAAVGVARDQLPSTLGAAAIVATAAATAGRRDENGTSGRAPHLGGDSRDCAS
jgi:hypothetical protein